MPRARTKLLCTTLLAVGLAAGAAQFAPTFLPSPALAQQRVEVRQEFRAALEPFGRFERHDRFGEVWRPTRVNRDWRPYTVGRWVYTDDWGWYWNADQSEGDWGWVVYHYGRWIDDRDLGWVWVAGDEWGPAWVNWRRGEGPAMARGGQRGAGTMRYIGWAPLPPDDLIVEYRDRPDAWVFVRARDIVAPHIQTVVIRETRPQILQQTVVVNRTVVVRDRGVIVNPGVEPAYVAAFVGRPIVAYDVRPRVIVGTARVNNAIEVRMEDLRDRRRIQETRPVLRETRTRIAPVRDVPPPQALQATDQGRLGDRPPRAAAEGAPDMRRDRTTTDQRGPQPGQRGPAAAQPGTDTTRTPAAPAVREGAPSERTLPGTAPGQRPAPATTGTAPQRPESPGQAATPPARPTEPQGRSTTAPGQQQRGQQTEERRSPAPERGAPGQQPREERGATQQRQERQQERQQERAAPAQSQERQAEPRGGPSPRGETTGGTPARGGADPGGAAREQRAPQRPEAASPGGARPEQQERRREREPQ